MPNGKLAAMVVGAATQTRSVSVVRPSFEAAATVLAYLPRAAGEGVGMLLGN